MKKIIVCCDGTWNKPGNKDRGKIVKTNVQKIYEAISSSNGAMDQVKYYGQGVGTGFSLRDHFLGGGTGLGIDSNIMDAYKFLMWNYEPGDEIYLFGFSRGAYTVRSLAGFIRNCGIMQPVYLHLMDEAYHLYRDRTSLTHPDSDLMRAFKRSYGIDREDTFIKFMGVWDTVGALGIPLKWFDLLNKKYQFHDVQISSQINYAYHALAVDERRGIFTPTLWEVSPNALSGENPQVSEQVWFPGVHSNIGGGYCDTGLSDTALQWMMEKAHNTGLAFDATYSTNIQPKSTGELRNSALGIYRIMRKITRPINNGIAIRTDKETGQKRKEKVIRNECIHYTCFERMHSNKKYQPRNVSDAVAINTPFDPTKENWKEEWLQYV
jgi:uncharacterized protein (DUF2235 family)